MQQANDKSEMTLTTEVDLTIGRLTLSLYPEFLLRSTGIPVALLADLRSPRARQTIEQYLTGRQALEQEQERFLNQLWPQALATAQERYPQYDPHLKPLYRVNKQVRRCLPLLEEDIEAWSPYGDATWALRWNTSLAEMQQAESSASAAYDEAKNTGRQVLHALFQDQRLQEAVFLSNPGFFERVLSRWADSPFENAPSKGTRQGEAIAHRYLRRFTVKCEAASFFGPTLFARLRATQPQTLMIGPRQPERIFVEASSWLINELSRLLSAQQPLERSRPRRNPLFQEQGEGCIVRVLDGRSYTLNPLLLKLWRLADGQRDQGEIATELHVTLEYLAGLVRKLGALLITQYEVPATAQKPLEYLATYDSEHGPVQQMLAIRDGFTQAPWPQRRQYFAEAEALCKTWGFEPRRGQGAHYADRTVFREDRSSPYNASLAIGQPAVTNIVHALQAVLPLCFVAALLVREDARESLRAVLQGKTLPLAQLAQGQIENRGWRAKQLHTSLVELLQTRAGGQQVVQISSKELISFLLPFWEHIAAEEVFGCLPGPDLMAIGNDLDTAKWVLAELHDDSSSIFGGNPATLHPDPAGLWQHFQDQVVKLVDPATMATIISRRRNKHITPELPGMRIELSGRASSSAYQTVPISEVAVEAEGRGILVRDRIYHLYPGDLSSILHRALALPCVALFPISMGDFTPRIEIDGVVYQRMRWQLTLPAGANGFERWKLLHTLKISHKLPERIYVRHPAEPKPLFVDFADPATVEDLGKLPPGVISATEMLPDPDQLWWQPDGQRQCSELRLGVLLSYQKEGSRKGTPLC